MKTPPLSILIIVSVFIIRKSLDVAVNYLFPNYTISKIIPEKESETKIAG